MLRITRRAASTALLLAFAGASGAQELVGIPAVDSSTVARQARSRGMRAFNAKDYPTAQRELTRAARAWPTQQGYLWAPVVASALAGDTAGVLTGLRSFLAVGLGRSMRSDTTIRAYLTVPAIQQAVVQLEANVAPITRSTVLASLPDSTFWPEGVDFDPHTRSYYIASIRHRTIAQRLANGTVRELFPRGRANLGAMLGVRVDTARGVLWATTSGIPQTLGYVPGDSAIAALLRIRISDGSIERRWDLPAVKGGHVLGDLAVGPRGDVFITDSSEPFLYRLRPNADTLERMTHPLFRSLQGVAPSRDGRALFVADYSHGLMRVDLATRAVTRLGDAPGSTSLGVDGIVLDDAGAIIAVQNGVFPARVMRFTLDAAGQNIVRAEVLDRNTAVADEPTIGTIARGQFVYVANSQWEKHDEKGVRQPSVPLTAPVLLAVPLQK